MLANVLPMCVELGKEMASIEDVWSNRIRFWPDLSEVDQFGQTRSS